MKFQEKTLWLAPLNTARKPVYCPRIRKTEFQEGACALRKKHLFFTQRFGVT
jgi:hypothetical protein